MTSDFTEWGIIAPNGSTVTVTLDANLFEAEFVVLVNSAYDVILGISFLEECGASMDCSACEVLLSNFVRSPHATNRQFLSLRA